MRKTRTIAVAAVAVVASATILVSSMAAFADQTNANSSNTSAKQFARGFEKVDPLERLEKEKAKIQQSLTDGKITQDEADKRITEIDQRIKALQEFNSMTVDQKKEKLLNDFTTSVNKQVTDGKLTQEEANKKITDYKAKLEQWDGTGYPAFMGKGFRGMNGFDGKSRAAVDPTQMLEKQKSNIQQKLADGKITQEEANQAIAKIEERAKEIQEFNSMTVEQKKEKLLNDFTTSINKRVKDGKLTQEQADKMIANYKAKVEEWDGTGYPFFMGKEFMGMDGFHEKFGAAVDPTQMLEKQKANIQQKLADGKITQEEANQAIAKIEEKAKEIQEFNSMTVEQKKEKLLNDFTTSINERVKDGKLTQEQADKMTTDFKAKLDQWDGSGNPPFHRDGLKGGKGFGGHSKKNADQTSTGE